MKISKGRVVIHSCSGKMSGSFGYCGSCNNFYRTSEHYGRCKKTGETKHIGDPCKIFEWEGIH